MFLLKKSRALSFMNDRVELLFLVEKQRSYLSVLK